MSRSLLGFRVVRSKELDHLQEQARLQGESRARVTELASKLSTAQDDLRATQARLRTAEESLRAAGEQTRARRQGRPADPPPMARELIGMADRLVDLAGDTPSDPVPPDAVLRWFGRQTEALLAQCDVVRIEDSGQLDLRRHEVVASRPAPGDDLVDQIADTVLPGYAWHGSLLRPQQVIVYIPARDEET